jgi:hypothetical protein
MRIGNKEGLPFIMPQPTVEKEKAAEFSSAASLNEQKNYSA